MALKKLIGPTSPGLIKPGPQWGGVVQPGTIGPPAQAGSPQRRVEGDLNAGMTWAKDQLKEGDLGRLDDAYKGQMDELLAKQKAGLDGLTPEEMQAAREQGNAEINRGLSSNMRMLGGAAAAQGVRGGAAAGLQAGALNAATGARGDLARKLVLDNIAQKNVAMDRYGNTLANQQGVSLGVGKYNIDQGNRETLGRLGLGLGYAGLVDSYRASDKASAFDDEQIKLGREGLKVFEKTGGYSGLGAANGGSGTGFNAIDAADTHKVNTLQKTSDDATDRLNDAFDSTKNQGSTPGSYKPTDPQKDLADLEAAKRAIEERVNLQYPGESEEWRKQKIAEEFAKVQEEANGGKSSCIITSEAMAQGLISRDWSRVTREYKLRKMKRDDIQVYWAWAASIVALMRRRRWIARAVSLVLPGTLTAMAKELGRAGSAPLHGHVFFGIYKTLNALFRPIVIKRDGSRMRPDAVARLFRMKRTKEAA